MSGVDNELLQLPVFRPSMSLYTLLVRLKRNGSYVMSRAGIVKGVSAGSSSKLAIETICLLILSSLFFLAGCAAHYPLNKPMEAGFVPEYQYSMTYEQGVVDDDLIIILAFSGGGTRAAALAYGTLEALDGIGIDWESGSETTMLDKVSMITSVSGGSFTAAYYGLNGKKIFDDFRERFLLRNVQGALLRMLFNPIYWPTLASPCFGRSDLAQRYYDDILFGGALMKDMRDPDRPAIVIMTTDLAGGYGFPIMPGSFEWICSDYYSFSVSRAVAASSAVPGLFTPIIIKNYADHCAIEIPQWMEESLKNRDLRSRTYHMAVRASAYLNQESIPYLYLVDGGVSDNLGIRTLIDIIEASGGIKEVLSKSKRDGVQRVAIIIVDAETRVRAGGGSMGKIPGLGEMLSSTSAIMISRYNFETIDLLYRTIRKWRVEDRGEAYPIEFYLTHITFNALSEESERDYFQGIPTSLALPEEQVDRVRKVAAKLLYSCPEFQRLLRDTGARPTANVVSSHPSKERRRPRGE